MVVNLEGAEVVAMFGLCIHLHDSGCYEREDKESWRDVC